MKTRSSGGRIAEHGVSDLQSKRAKYNESKKNYRMMRCWDTERKIKIQEWIKEEGSLKYAEEIIQHDDVKCGN